MFTKCHGRKPAGSRSRDCDVLRETGSAQGPARAFSARLVPAPPLGGGPKSRRATPPVCRCDSLRVLTPDFYTMRKEKYHSSGNQVIPLKF